MGGTVNALMERPRQLPTKPPCRVLGNVVAVDMGGHGRGFLGISKDTLKTVTRKLEAVQAERRHQAHEATNPTVRELHDNYATGIGIAIQEVLRMAGGAV
mgnify:CR=1 FL=1